MRRTRRSRREGSSTSSHTRGPRRMAADLQWLICDSWRRWKATTPMPSCAALAEPLECRRLLSAGHLDPTFSFDGRQAIDLGPNSGGLDVAVQRDGKLLVAGRASNATDGSSDAILIRFNLDGSLDGSFGSSGMVRVDFGENERFLELAILPDGKIVAGGQRSDARWMLARFTPDGRLDVGSGFGGMDGVQEGDGQISQLALQGDAILTASRSLVSPAANIVRRHVGSTGAIDTSFGSGGSVVVAHAVPELENFRELEDLAVQPDGKIIVAGVADGADVEDDPGARAVYGIGRLTGSGVADDSFGTGGGVRIELDVEASGANAVAIRANDSAIFVAGTDAGPDANLVHLSPLGEVIEIVDLPSPASILSATTVLVDGVGGVVVAGSIRSPSDFGVARFNADLTLDTTFGVSGLTLVDFPNPESDRDVLDGAAMDPQGRIVVAGTSGSGDPVAVARLQAVQQPFRDGPFRISSTAVTIQAEDYDTGGQGIAYNDIDSKNDGGQYRPADGVDIMSHGSGLYRVGGPKAGEWMEYTIDVQEAGEYELEFRVSQSASGAQFHAEIDRVNVSGPLTAPNTGSFNTFMSVTETVTLSAGQHVLRLAQDANASNGYAAGLDWVKLTRVAEEPDQQPFHGGPFTIGATPVTIQAEDYDLGGEGVAYHDTDAKNDGNQYRPTDGVDIMSHGSGLYRVGGPKAGEWLEYMIDVQEAGEYELEFRVSQSASGAQFHAEVDGGNVTGLITAPNTDSFNTFTSVTETVTLAAGTHVLRVAQDTNAANGYAAGLDSIQVTRIPDEPAQQPFHGAPFVIGAAPVTIQAEDYDLGGEGIAYHDTDGVNDGGQYRPGDGVDIMSHGSGLFRIGGPKAGEWMEYTIDVQEGGDYRLEFRVSQSDGGSTFHAEVDGVNMTGPLTAPATGSFNTFTSATETVSLTAGQHVLRLAYDTAAANGYAAGLDWMRLTPVTPPAGGSIEIVDRILIARGTEDADAISTERTGTDDVIVRVNSLLRQFDMDDFDGVRLEGLGGNDRITVVDSLNVPVARRVTINGGAGNDTLTGNDENDSILGGDGDDMVLPGAGDDSISGGGGTDTVDYSGHAAGLNFSLTSFMRPEGPTVMRTGETDTLATFLSAEDDRVLDTERFIGTAFNDDFHYQASENDQDSGFPTVTMEGRGGNDSFSNGGIFDRFVAIGGDGDDGFFVNPGSLGSAAETTLIGGDGNDTFAFDDDTGPDSVDGGGGIDFISLSFFTQSVVDLNEFASVENARSGSPDVLLIGTPGPNRLETTRGGTVRGGDGDDTLVGSHDPDSLLGEGGNDSMVGNEGNDTLVGGDGDDTLDGGDGDDFGDGGPGSNTLISIERTPDSEPAQEPFHAAPFTIGDKVTTVQAEDYDFGGEGVAYHDTDAVNDGNQYRSDDGVDIMRHNADFYRIGGPKAGEWMEYTIDVQRAGNYELEFRVSQTAGGSTFHVEVDGTDVTGPLTAPATGGFNTFTSVRQIVALPAGAHVLRMAYDSEAANGYAAGLDSITIAPQMGIIDGVFVARGTDGDDAISIRREGSTGITVTVNDASLTMDMQEVGNIRLMGQGGADRITVLDRLQWDQGARTVTLDGGRGNDTLTSHSLGDLLLGGDGDDSLVGSFGDDTLDGGVGTDIVDPGPGEDVIANAEIVPPQGTISIVDRIIIADGAWGQDAMSVWSLGDGKFRVAVNDVQRGFNISEFDGILLRGFGGYDDLRVASPIEFGTLARKVTLEGGAGDDYLAGNSGDEVLRGGDGNDVLHDGFGGFDALFGNAGNDTLTTAAGPDFLDGGDGDDSLDAANGAPGDTVLGGNGKDTARVDAGDETSGVETFA